MNTTETNPTQVLTGNALEDFFTNPDSIVLEEKKEEVIPMEEFFSPEKKEEKKEEVPTTVVDDKTSPQPTFYSEMVKTMLEDKDWQDGEIEIENEKGEVEIVLLSELKDITPDLFKQIKEAQKTLKEEDFNSKYVSVEGLDDTTKKMIELKRKGGDLTELIQLDAEFVHPLQSLDLESEQVHEYLIREKYKALGWKPNHIETEIKDLKESFTLDTEAKKVIEEVNSNFNSVVERKTKEREEAVLAEKEKQKEFKKSITDTYKALNLKESIVKTLVDNTAKFDENGLTNVDRAFFEAKKNPEKFARVAFLLTDENAYNEFEGIKTKNAVTKDTVRKILTITPKTATSTATEKKGTEMDEFFKK